LFFKLLKAADPYRDPALLPTPGTLDFCDGLAASTGHVGAEGDTVTTKCCLLKQLLNPERDSKWFRGVASDVSRVKRWGATMGNSAIIRELVKDPSGDTLEVLNKEWWVHAANVGGYGKSTKGFPLSLTEALAAPLNEGGFAGRPAAGAPFAGGTPEQRAGVLQKGIYKSVKYAMEGHATVFATGLHTNFHARLRRAVQWWCDTHLPLVALKAENGKRTHAILCAITGEPCDTPPLPASKAFVELQRLRLFGEKGHVHYRPPPAAGESGVNVAWLGKHLMRTLIASAHLLKDAEDAWDSEAASGRVSAWRDTSALRAGGGAVDARAGVFKEEEEVAEGSPEVLADAAAEEMASKAAIAAAVAAAMAMGCEVEGGEEGDGKPPWHPPHSGAVPPPLFALTPHASILVGHATFDANTLYQHLGVRTPKDVDFGAVFFMDYGRKLPVGATMTTDGVVACFHHRTIPKDPRARRVLGVEDPPDARGGRGGGSRGGGGGKGGKGGKDRALQLAKTPPHGL